MAFYLHGTRGLVGLTDLHGGRPRSVMTAVTGHDRDGEGLARLEE